MILAPTAKWAKDSIPLIPDLIILDFVAVFLSEPRRAVSITLPSAYRSRIAPNAIAEHIQHADAVLGGPVDAEISVPVVEC